MNTSTGTADVTLTAVVSDDLSGLASYLNYTLTWPNGGGLSTSMTRISGTSLSGTYQDVITMPQFSPVGRTSISLAFRDLANNVLSMSSAQLASAGFPNGFDQTGAGDSQAPRLVGFSVSPTTIDTSAGPVDVTITAAATDDLAGMERYLNYTLTWPAGGGLSTSLTQVSGTPLAGTWSDVVTVPQWSPPGRTTLSIHFRDKANNSLAMTAAQLADAGWPSSFLQTGPGDTQPPRLIAFSVSPTSISTGTGPVDVTITATVTDDLSGMESYLNYTLTWPVGGGLSTSLTRTSGSALNGTYSDVVTVPRYSPLGATTLSVNFRDRANNALTMSAAQLADAGFPSSFVNR